VAKRALVEVVYAENQLNGYRPGDESAHIAASALAQLADAPTISALADIVRLTDLIGGQVTITSLREGASQAGEWETKGLHVQMETRDARMVVIEPPDEVFGLPVIDFLEDAPVATRVPVPDPNQNGTAPEPERCEVCGRVDPAERLEDPPCQCQVTSAEVPEADEQPAEPVSAE
jgi:hypothetical protein